MSAIGPGDWVECVAAAVYSDLRVGSIYRCTDIDTLGGYCRFHNDICDWGLRLDGVRPRVATAFCGKLFRPIYRPKADFLESLLTPADAPSEREGVDA